MVVNIQKSKEKDYADLEIGDYFIIENPSFKIKEICIKVDSHTFGIMNEEGVSYQEFGEPELYFFNTKIKQVYLDTVTAYET